MKLREKISEINEESDAEEEDLSEEKTTYITDEMEKYIFLICVRESTVFMSLNL